MDERSWRAYRHSLKINHATAVRSPAFMELALPKRLTLTIPHDLGATEVRRRIDLHMDWAVRKLEAEKIEVEAKNWLDNCRAFSGRGYGQKASVTIQVAEDMLQIEALVPWVAGVFAPLIESVGRDYAGRLLSEHGRT